jgi:ABC-type transporter Mla subunit MlaD
MSEGVQLPLWITGSRRWVQEVQSELAQLPDTLRRFRESVGNLQVITQRLVDATAAMEQLTALSAPMVDARRRMDEAADSVRERLGTRERSDPIASAMADLGDAASAMADLNPFLRRQKPARKPPPPGDERT